MISPTDKELRDALTAYPRALTLRAAASKSSKDLAELDEWYRGELRDLMKSRRAEDEKGRAWLTVAELGRLMEWKLARGKWRPRLVTLALSNSAELVRSVTLESSILPADKALTHLSTLSGIGPATASAIIALFSPSEEPFMSDEAMEAVSGGVKADYTVKRMRSYREKMQARVQSGKWEVDELEKAYWSWTVLKRYKGGQGEGAKKAAAQVEKPKGGKRKSEVVESKKEEPKASSARADRAAKKAKAF